MHELITLTLLLSLTACSASQPDASAPVARAAQPARSMGVEQGNGVVVYDNPAMGVKFSYPAGWKLLEDTDRTSAKLTSPDSSASLTFSYTPSLDGRRFDGAAALTAYLKQAQPAHAWGDLNMLGSAGAAWSEAAGTLDTAEYYLLDSHDFILHVSLTADARFPAEGVVREILRSMILDEEPPVVSAVGFDRAEVRPGETVHLMVHAHDRLSGIQLESMGGKPRDQGDWHFDLDTQRGALGYADLPFPARYSEKPEDQVATDLIFRALPLAGQFRYAGDDTYVYDVAVPPSAPLGEIALNILDVSDYFGNKTRLSLFYGNDEGFGSTYLKCDATNNLGKDSGIARASFRVVDPHDPSYQPDSRPPELADLYFDQTSIDLSTPTIAMDLVARARDEILWSKWSSDVFAKDEDIQFDFNIDGGLSNCVSKTGVERIEKNHYRFHLDFSQCVAQGRFANLTQTRIVVKPMYVRLRSAIGVHAEVRDAALERIPRARFYIRLR
jgi:hypothetical protein